MDKEIKVCADGFVWKVISYETAIKLMESEIFEVYVLYYDESESLVESRSELDEHHEMNYQFGIEVGFPFGEAKKQTFIFGTEMVDAYNDGVSIEDMEELTGEVKEIEMTQRELDVYTKGLCDMDGWNKFDIIEQITN